MTAQESYRQLIRDYIAPGIRALGFRGSGANYHRRIGDDWQIVNLQKSAFSDREHIKFTINLGVGLTSERGGSRTWPDERPPPANKCHLGERIGFAGGADRDVWWDIDSRSDLAVLAADVLERLSSEGLPWLDRAYLERRDRRTQG